MLIRFLHVDTVSEIISSKTIGTMKRTVVMAPTHALVKNSPPGNEGNCIFSQQ